MTDDTKREALINRLVKAEAALEKITESFSLPGSLSPGAMADKLRGQKLKGERWDGLPDALEAIGNYLFLKQDEREEPLVPFGSPQRPVDNLAEAIRIAKERNLRPEDPESKLAQQTGIYVDAQRTEIQHRRDTIKLILDALLQLDQEAVKEWIYDTFLADGGTLFFYEGGEKLPES